MLRHIVLFQCFIFAISASAVIAKPLINSSEMTLEKMCLDFEEDYKTLVEACEAAIAQDGNTRDLTAELLLSLGNAYYYLDDIEKSIEVLNKAVSFDAQDVGIFNALGWSYRELDRYEQSFEMFTKSIAIAPTPEGLAGYGTTALESGNGDLEKAIQYLDAALALDPEYIWAGRQKGWLFYNADEYEASAVAYKDVLQIAADDKYSNYALARTLQQMSRSEEALKYVNIAIETDTATFYEFTLRSRILRGLDRNAQAAREAERAIDIEPNLAEGYIHKARALFALGKRKESLKTMDRAVEMAPESSYLFYWFAWLLSDDGQNQRALEMVDRSIAQEDADYSDHQLKAYIALEMKDFDVAVQSAKESIALNPDAAYSHFYAALGLVQTGEIEASETEFSTAMALNPQDHMLSDYAAGLISRGRFVEAIQVRLKYRSNSAD